MWIYLIASAIDGPPPNTMPARVSIQMATSVYVRPAGLHMYVDRSRSRAGSIELSWAVLRLPGPMKGRVVGPRTGTAAVKWEQTWHVRSLKEL